MMDNYIDLEEWLSVIKKEYLQDFIRNGGAAVKFAVPCEAGGRVELSDKLGQLVAEEDFFFVFIDAARLKIHMVDHIFHQVARQVDWDNLAYLFLRKSLGEHYKLPDNRPEFNLKQIAVLNGTEEREMRFLINRRLRDALFRDYAMTQEFRLAMLRLCQAQLDPLEVPSDLCQAIKEWLRGELRLVSAVKQALIFQKVGRHNARHLLLSLSHWIKLAGKSGLVLMLDTSRYLSDKPKEPDGSFYYSKSAVMDCYEVLRQFIDGTDESDFLLVVVVSLPQFTTDERRGLPIYDALKLRIWDEVYDKTRVNPVSSLVRITTCARDV